MSRRRDRHRRSEYRERDGHTQKRAVIRLAGFALLSVGGVFLAIGLIDFFSAFSGSGAPTKFWMVMIGLPMCGFGGMLLSAGYQREIAQYQMREMTPAITETFDDVAAGTHDSVRHLAGAIGEGLRGGGGSATQSCPSCQHVNDASARFCDDCGTPLARACAACNEPNDGDAKFCNACGAKFA